MAQQTKEYAYDVFLCYSSADKRRVRQIAEKLRGEGVKVWFDEWIIAPGDSIPLMVDQGLTSSRVLVLCMSRAAFGSDWVSLEYSTAMFRSPSNRDRRFIPLLLDECAIPESIAHFRNIDAKEFDEESLSTLVDACRPLPATRVERETRQRTSRKGANEPTAPVVQVPVQAMSLVRSSMLAGGAAIAAGFLATLAIFWPTWAGTWIIAVAVLVFGIGMYVLLTGRYMRKASALISLAAVAGGAPSINARLNIIDVGDGNLLLANSPYFAVSCIIAAVIFAFLDSKSRHLAARAPSPADGLHDIGRAQSPVAADQIKFDNSTNVGVGDGAIGHAEQAGGAGPAIQGGVHHHHYPRFAPPAASPKVLQEPPHVPGDLKVSTARLPNTGQYLFGRDTMLADLDCAWNDNQTNVFALVAGGGVGKSTLVNHWLAGMGKAGYRGARRVYGHSFYSQGTSDGTASADAFFATALKWFGDPDTTKGSAWARGVRLAELVRKERTLLILDGMEPLQLPPGPSAGRVTDPGLQALLRELAGHNPGLCVVTTREHVTDLDRFAGAGAAQKNIEDLPNEAGAELLKQLGVKGPLKERKEASKEFDNHALALTLLGTYLVKACDGDIRRRGEVSLMKASDIKGGHARSVMKSYEKWFTKHNRSAELSIVRMLGLFNRPAEAGCIAALRDGEPIADLTAGLADIAEDDWNIAVANLREAGLLAKAAFSHADSLDAHPLVREHFADRLENDLPDAWRAGHDRLYEHLRGDGCKKELPDTAEEMAPLYSAVHHGCAAGRHQEAFDEVYRRRVQRGSEFYSSQKLGAFGGDLGALAGLFEEPWRRPVASLSEADQAFVLNEAGVDLRALGRLAEAVEPMRAGLERRIAQEEWENAARAGGSVSELDLTLGRIDEAIDSARQSVDFADRSGGAFMRMVSRTVLGDALHQARRAPEALTLFREAERMQKEWQPEYPLLYSARGYQYCELLLGRGDHQGVIDRATQTLEWATKHLGLLANALDHLSLGRAHLLAARAVGTDAYKKAWVHIDLAVDGLREAGQLQELPRGLLARAELYLFTGDHAEARAALNEAKDIATRDPQGHMKLFVTDCHLGYARLALAEKKPDVARGELAKARALIKETGYHRRDAELADLEQGLDGPTDPDA